MKISSLWLSSAYIHSSVCIFQFHSVSFSWSFADFYLINEWKIFPPIIVERLIWDLFFLGITLISNLFLIILPFVRTLSRGFTAYAMADFYIISVLLLKYLSAVKCLNYINIIRNVFLCFGFYSFMILHCCFLCSVWSGRWWLEWHRNFRSFICFTFFLIVIVFRCSKRCDRDAYCS